MSTTSRFACFVVAAAIVACSGKSQDPPGNTAQNETGDAGTVTGEAGADTNRHDPIKHRPTAAACAVSPASKPATLVTDPDAGPLTQDGTCTTDAECGTSDGNWKGHCIAYPGVASKMCNYDECTADSDCGSTGVCSCEGLTRGYAGGSPGNTCVKGNCRVDGDCGAGGFCSPTFDPDCGSFYGIQGWYCHTAQDECVNDEDCGSQAPGLGNPHCSYRPEVGHWKCENGACAG